MSYQKKEFLEIFKKKIFASEESMERYFVETIPAILRVSEQRVLKQVPTTSFEGKQSNICDVVVLSKTQRKQVIIVFELKLDKNVKKYSDYETAKKQLHKYCQDLNSPYGILLSETKCIIFHYEYDGSELQHIEIQSLPPTEEIEKEVLGMSEVLEEIKSTMSKSEKEKEESREQIREDMLEHQKAANQKNSVSRIIIYLLAAILAIGIGVFIYYRAIVNQSCEEIKGNITTRNGVVTKIYHTKDSPSYDATQIDKSKGEEIFCSEKDAINAGFRRWIEYKE